MIKFSALPLLLLVSLLLPAEAGAYEDPPHRITGEFWAELEPVSLEGAQYGPPSREEQIRAMLEEARFVFSGIVYGFSFVYTPSDNTRRVEEVFTVEPAAEIPRGTPRLEVRQTYTSEGKVYALIDYHLEEFERYRLEAWKKNTTPRISGRGEGVYFSGPEEKITAHKNAVKSAVREYLRKQTYNKPKEAAGRFVFTEAPRVFAEGGRYVSAVDIKLLLDKLTPYTVF
jgi:hypothetical protein